ncbi:hypothetical protein GCM10025298_25530 [Natronobiforma cellulositropha]
MFDPESLEEVELRLEVGVDLIGEPADDEGVTGHQQRRVVDGVFNLRVPDSWRGDESALESAPSDTGLERG